MNFDEPSLDSFGQLAKAIGLLDPAGNANGSWFTDPIGAAGPSGNQHGLRHILEDDDQRAALLGFVDEILGPPESTRRDRQTWIPLFRNDNPRVTVFAVVAQSDGQVQLGAGLEHTTVGGPPTVATRVHVPIFRVARRDGPALPDDDLPGWLLLGRRDAHVGIGVEMAFTDAAPAAGTPALGGVGLTLGVPTAAGNDLSIGLQLRDLQLPGANDPRTFSLDAANLSELGSEVFELLVGLVRAQAGALGTTDPVVGAITGLLGLREVAGLPPLPLAQLPSAGLRPLVDWVEQILEDGTARDAWLGQLATLVGGTLDAARDAVVATLGPLRVAVGVRVQPGPGGRPVLTPFVELSMATRDGVRARLSADLLRADTGTGACTALPDVRLEAVFGADAGGSALLPGTGDAPHVGSLHTGVALDARGQPTFVLTLHDTRLGGRTHPVLDLSSPAAALDSATEVIADALAAAIAGLGPPGVLVNRLLGLDPPDAVAALDVVALLGDPLAEVLRYWRDLTALPAAGADVLGRLRSLLTGTVVAATPGVGSAADPWRVTLVASPAGDIAAGLDLLVWRDGPTLAVDLTASVSTPVLIDHRATVAIGLTVVRLDLAEARAAFATEARATLSLAKAGGATMSLPLAGLVLVADRIAVATSWQPVRGLRCALAADGLAIGAPGATDERVAFALPTLDSSGRMILPAPDWAALERVLARLLRELRVPVVDTLLDLVGWDGPGAHLALAGLLGTDPGAAVRTWLADLVLDCGRVRFALGPLAALLSGFRTGWPLGRGDAVAPYRCPIAGEARAPGLAVWLDPGCQAQPSDLAAGLGWLVGPEPPETSSVVAALRAAAPGLPDLAGLLVARDALDDGLDALLAQWAGTDGLVGLPDAALPDGVTAMVLDDLTYDELLALGSTGLLVNEVFDTAPAAVVHVGCEPTWTAGRVGGTAFDLSAAHATDLDSADTVAGTLPATGAGTWYVRLPGPAAAAAARPDRGAVGEQATRLAAMLAGRTEPVVLVAYGACGAAAILAAGPLAAVTDVVTVGTPWAPPGAPGPTGTAAGDAVRLLNRLRQREPVDWRDALVASEASSHRQVDGLARRSAETSADDLPPANAQPRRAGLAVRAVFGNLDEGTLARGLGAFVADAIQARLEAARVGAVPADAAPAGPAAAPGERVRGLRAGVDLPMLALERDGLLVGVAATVELCRIDRAAGGGLVASPVRAVLLDVRVGVRDGWLVGGPASTTPTDLRWLSARIAVPLDGRPGEAELVLHEARALGVDRQRWVVRPASADAAATSTGPEPTGDAVSTAVPEVRLLVSAVTDRLRAAWPDLGALLDLIGLTRDGGLDPGGLDRLLHDTAATACARLAADPSAFASRLRALLSASGTATGGADFGGTDAGVTAVGGTGPVVRWTVGVATAEVDLAAGRLTVGAGLHEPGLPPIAVDLSLSAAATSATAALGAIDPDAGGLRLIARTAPSPTLAVEWAAPRAPTRTIALLPNPDGTGLGELATVVLPAVAAHAMASAVRGMVSEAARPALDAALAAVGLLTAPDPAGHRGVVVPVGLFTDPGGWLRHGIREWRDNAAGSAVDLLDAMAPLVVPARGAARGWPIADGVRLDYGVESGNRLRLALNLALSVDVAGATVTTGLDGGLTIGPDALPQPVLAASVDIDGRGLLVAVDPTGDPAVRLSLVRAAPAPPLALYPAGPGLGDVLSAAGEMVVPVVLNAVAARRSDPGDPLTRDVGQAVFDLGEALGLVAGGQFTGARVAGFAADPAGALVTALPRLVATAVARLAAALDPYGRVVSVIGSAADRVTLGFGHGAPVRITLDATTPVAAIEIGADVLIPDLGRFRLDRLRLSASGVDVAAQLGPVELDFGPFALRPLLLVQAGSAAGLVGLGLSLDDPASATQRTVEVRWALDATPPALVAVDRVAAGESVGDEVMAAQRLLALGLSLAGGVIVESLRGWLTATARDCLRGVVFTDAIDSTEVDPTLAIDLFFHPEALLARLRRLLWNAAGLSLSVTIDGLVVIGLASRDLAGGRTALGATVALAAGRRFPIADGDTRVELEVDADWVNPAVDPGLAIYLLEGPSAAELEVVPAVSVAGLGLRFTNQTGPLLALGAVSLDGLAVHIYGEITSAGAGGGVNLELAGLAIAPGGGGGGNPVANGIMNDAGQSGPASRPTFSPSLAVQQHPGRDLSVSLRAGQPPGPWWIVVQRQLGPLYLDRLGFDTAETGGTISRITLLFDGRVSIFGLTAAVDQLSINWLGGDLLDISSWAVDLMGLAISADLSGAQLSGGLLKTAPPGEPVSYVGMLLGRFGTYGLSVFGGYTDDAGNPSFFIFGALNGPIGGPPAFFITGIAGGLGIHRELLVPTDVTAIAGFPFIAALDPAARAPADPMARLRELTEYFPVQRGNFWFAAGIGFNCFALVDGVAVLAVSFGDELEINLLGLARLALPRPGAELVSIELALLARFSTREGVFIIIAQLTENSWLLYRDVRLTGGFAFAVWWKGPLAGHCVLTLGGYHPDFHRDGYPEVPRLGLTWRISDAIVIKGGAYFALTSEALMAGLDVEVSVDLAIVWVRIALGAHGIVYFDPFWFEVLVYARICAGINLGLFSISISLGAQIKVWGPDFSGEATLEMGPVTLTVGFGSAREVRPQALAWAQFVAKYLEDAGDGAARALSAITGRGSLPAATGGERSAPTPDGRVERPFEVYAEFELTVVSTVPFAEVVLDRPVAVPVTRSDGAAAVLGLRAMQAGGLDSTLRIQLQRYDDEAGEYVTNPPQRTQLGRLAANLYASRPDPAGSAVGRDAFPIGAWGQPDPPDLPAPALPTGDVIVAGSQVRLVAQARLDHRGPEIEYYRVDAARRPLPLQAGGTSRAELLRRAATVTLPAVGTAEQALDLAQHLLFPPAPDGAGVGDGVPASPARSGVARAAYRGEVSAPPLFGTLADGMAPGNSASGTATSAAPAVASVALPAPRYRRDPIIAGYLTAGAGAAARPAITTVADRVLPRVAAPTLDSVRLRLGINLPIRLLRTAQPALPRGGTAMSTWLPVTDSPGIARSYGLGSVGVGLAGPAAGTGGWIPAGGLVVLTLPDAAVDAGPAAAVRPVLSVEGSARVTVLRGAREVAFDGVVTSALPVPERAALVAVQAGAAPTLDGLAGWHLGSRVCALGSAAALAAGCVITTRGQLSTSGVGWSTAGEALAGAPGVLTRFGAPVRTVALIVEASGERLDHLGIQLFGARRAQAGGGGPELPPIVVLAGRQAVVVFAVEPERSATGAELPVAVRLPGSVKAASEQRLTGVLGGDLSVDDLARLVAQRGIAVATARLLATGGTGSRVSWTDPSRPAAAGPKKRRWWRRGRG